MLRIIAAVAVLAACSCLAYAQTEVEAQSNVILPDGRRNLVITNRSSKTIAAFAFQIRSQLFSPGKGPFAEETRDMFYDSVLYSMEPSIGPGKQLAMPAGPGHAPGDRIVNSPADFKAALFDDGSAFGDPAWVARIRDRRVIVIETIDAEIAFLAAAQTRAAGGEVTRESLATELGQEKAARVKGDADPDHQRIIGGQYTATAHGLTGANLDVPIGESLTRLRGALRGQRDKMAKASGIMFPAKVAPTGSAGQQ